MSKTIILVRHGESLAQTAKRRGLPRTDPSLHDCNLSRKGESQAKGLCKHKSLRDGIELVVVSPLTRALRTALLGFRHLSRENDVPFICYPGLKERGSKVPENWPRSLKKILKDEPELVELKVEFSLVPPEWPDQPVPDTEWPDQPVPDTATLGLLIPFLLSRSEQKIVVVAHSNVIKCLLPRLGGSVNNCAPIVCTLSEHYGLQLQRPSSSSSSSSSREPKQVSSNSNSNGKPKQVSTREALLDHSTLTNSNKIRLAFCQRPEQRKPSFVKVMAPNSAKIAKVFRNNFQRKKQKKKKKNVAHQLVLRRTTDGKRTVLREDDGGEMLPWLQNGDIIFVGSEDTLPPTTPAATPPFMNIRTTQPPPSLLVTTTCTPTAHNNADIVRAASFTETTQLKAVTSLVMNKDSQVLVEQNAAISEGKTFFEHNKSTSFTLLAPGTRFGTALQSMRKALRGGEHGLYEKNNGGLVCFDYRTADAKTFPDVHSSSSNKEERWTCLARRESRGLLIDRKTGNVVARRVHKFFNVGERDFTTVKRLPSLNEESCVLLEKLDGCLVSPLFVGDEEEEEEKEEKEEKTKDVERTCTQQRQLRWATKTIISSELEQFVGRYCRSRHDVKDTSLQNSGLLNFCRACINDLGATPIFEWCRRLHPIVVHHSTDRLVLLSVRHMSTGVYMQDATMRKLAAAFGVKDVVRRLDINLAQTPDVSSLVSDIAENWKGVEGAVLAWPNQAIYVKIKTSWYVERHGGGDGSSSSRSRSRLGVGRGAGAGVVNLVRRLAPVKNPASVPVALLLTACLSTTFDDVVAAVAALDQRLAEHFRQLRNAVDEKIRSLSQQLAEWAVEARETAGGTRAKFARVVQELVFGSVAQKTPWSTRTLMLHSDVERKD